MFTKVLSLNVIYTTVLDAAYDLNSIVLIFNDLLSCTFKALTARIMFSTTGTTIFKGRERRLENHTRKTYGVTGY